VANVHEVNPMSPFHVPHLYWRCLTSGRDHEFPISFEALIDHGSSSVLIRDSFVNDLGLKRRRLSIPFSAELAMENNGQKVEVHFSEYVKLQLHDPSSLWSSKSVRAIIAPSLCAPMILGLPFLSHNNIVVDASARSAINKNSGFDLLNPVSHKVPVPKKKLKEFFKELKEDRKLLVAELNMVCTERRCRIKHKFEPVKPFDIVGAMRGRIEVLAAQEKLKQMGMEMITEFKDVFTPIPHLDKLPTNVYCRIKLKDATKTVTTRTYTTPRKYCEAWAVLIQQHLDAGHIRPSNSEHASPAFLVPKADKIILPRWVNDYRVLNANTVLNAHPLPHVNDILADCAKGKIWSKIDMTNSFFQTWVHPDDVHLTAVTTPFGLYEWLAMPMGLRNLPAIHQRCVTAALHELLGRICHMYLDDIVIWSNTVAEHERHVRMVLEALRKARLYCNPKKCEFFLLELEFLCHHISA
jgi:Reverse transcriptase (RNA-dependent DNA polymerase)/Aspartyl protease